MWMRLHRLPVQRLRLLSFQDGDRLDPGEQSDDEWKTKFKWNFTSSSVNTEVNDASSTMVLFTFLFVLPFMKVSQVHLVRKDKVVDIYAR